MNLSRTILWFYQRLMRLYPHRFRTEYGAEMLEVFATSLESSRLKWRAEYVGALWQELRSLPASILRMHFREAAKEALWQEVRDA